MIYLDNAATTKFKPKHAMQKLMDLNMDSCNFSRSTHKQALSISQQILDFREYIKSCINVNSNKIIFTYNCSEALNMAILGHSKIYKKPIHIISTAFEHNSTLRPIHNLYCENKAYYTIIYPEKNLLIDVDKIYKSITDNTKMIVVNHTSNVTSSCIDLDKLKDICSQKKVKLIVDAAQSFGHEFIDFSGIDAMCIASHKALCGPQGVGILILDKNMEILPIKYGGVGINSQDLNQPNIYPDGFEVGTQNAPCILSLFESFKYVYKNKEKINRKICTLSYYLHSKLKSLKNYKVIGIDNAACFLLLSLKSDQNLLYDYLNENDVYTRFGLHCAPIIHSYLNTIKTGAVRISIGYNNTLDEMDKLVYLLSIFDNIY